MLPRWNKYIHRPSVCAALSAWSRCLWDTGAHLGGEMRSHCLIRGQEAVTGQGEAIPDHSYTTGCLYVVSTEASGFLNRGSVERGLQ